MKNHNLSQSITQPTRITSSPATIIDHVWCNNEKQYAHQGVLDTGLSDHSLVLLSRKKGETIERKRKDFHPQLS